MAKGGLSSGLIDPRYCCCAIPMVNTGIHAILTEQAVLGIALGVTALTTPDVVGAAFPGFATIIFAIVCFAVAVVQPIGFIGVLREKTSTFKFYSLLNAIAVTAAFSTAAALIIVSALRHSTAVSACEHNYFSNTNATTTASSIPSAANGTLSAEGQALCNPFAWVDVGIMGGLWVLLLLAQGYFLYVTRTYSVSQVSDHKLYHSVYSENPEAFTMSVLRSTRYNPGSVYNAPPPGATADAWDPRPSMDEGGGYDGKGYGHQRDFSDASARYEDAYAEGSHAYPNEDEYGRGEEGYGYAGAPGQYPFSTPGGGYVDHPAEARSRDPGQTPTVNNYEAGQGVGWRGGDGGLRRPEEVRNHPGLS